MKVESKIYPALFFLLIISIWAFNEDKFITYPIKIAFILVYGWRWLRSARLKINHYQAWSIVMIILSAFSIMMAGSVSTAMHTFINMLQVCLIAFVGVHYIDSKDKINFIVKCIIIGGCIMGVRLVLTTPLHVWTSFDRLGEGIGYNPNDVGNKAAFSAIFSMALMRNTTGKKKTMLTIIFMLMSVLVLFSGSRKALLAVAFAVLLFYTIGLEKKRNLIFAIIGIGILFGIVYYLMMNNEALYATIGRRIESMIGVLRFGKSEKTSIDLREKYMDVAWRFVKQYPLTGIGLANFAVKSGFGVYCHCDYLEVLCGYGIIGAIVYYSPFFKVVLSTLFLKKKNQMDYTILIIILVLFLNFFTMVMYTSAYTQIILMICLAYQGLRNNENNVEENKESLT